MENKVRYKLHKVKKQWVTLAVASVALATIVGASVTTSSLVSAEEINNTNGSPSTTTVGENTNPVVEKEVGTTTEVANTSNATTTDRAAVTADKPAETTVQPNSGATSDRAAAVEVEAKPETTAKPEVAAKPETATTSEVATNAGVAAPTTEKSKELSEAEIKAAVSLDNIKKEKDGKYYYLLEDGSHKKNFAITVNGQVLYFDENGVLSSTSTYSFTQETTNLVTDFTKNNAAYDSTKASFELVDGYLTADSWYRPKEILKDGKEWTASTENDKRPLLTVWWPSKAIQASYLNYMKEQGLGTNQTYTSFSSQTQMDQAALEVQKRIEERIAREGNTDWLRTTIKNFVKTQPGWNSTSENLDNNDHLQGGALLYNNDSRTSHANSDYRLLNRTPTSQTGKHNPKYTKDTSNGGFEFLLANDIDNSNPAVQAEQLNWLHYIMNIGTITGGSEDENFDGVRVDAVDNVNADLLQIASDYFKAKYGSDQSQEQAIKHLSILEAWSHNDAYYNEDTKGAQLPMDDPMHLALVYSLLRPIGNRSGVEPLISNSLNDRSESGKNSKRMANYSFVRAHDSEVQSIIGQIIKNEINPQSTGNTFTLDEMKKAFEIYNRDMRSANKQYTQYNIPSAYALMLTHKDTVPRVYYGDMYTDDGQYMAQKSPYYDAIETLLKGRIRYAAGGQDMKVNYIGYGNTNGWDAAGVLTSVRYGTGANSASDAGTAETRNQGMAVIV